ncbi:TPA: queuosine precursor transporter [Candidatus Woesearchaeota archaeon]|nr:queuosine precursor transporter [Candidatus Woesearchaeota archaeon]HII69340.1 queuosine precursor transporter [Candidatus Woesearchaeota archaeon]
MLNEALWIVMMLASFSMILLAYVLFGKAGIYAWTAIAMILANIQVMRTVQLFGMVTAMGNIIYGTTFLATDILSENYGKKEAKKAVWIGFFTLIATTIVMQLSLLFVPDASDFSNDAMHAIFGFLPRIAIASITAYLISQTHDIITFTLLKERTKGKHLWLRNNLSTIISQLIDNIVFTWIAFVGLFGLFGWKQLFPWEVIIEIFVISYILKVVVALCDTPIVYLARMMKKKGMVTEV